MRWRWLKWVGVVVLVVIVALGSVLTWVLTANSGTRWALARVGALLDDALQIERIDGSIAGPLTLAQVRYRNPGAGIDVSIEQVNLDLVMRDLPRTMLHVANLELAGVVVALSQATAPPEPATERKPFNLDAPINIAIDRFALRQASVRRDQQTLLQIDRAAFAGRWTDTNVVVRQLDVEAAQGDVHFIADVKQSRYYEGNGRGRFRWQVGTRTFAGTLAATGREATTHLSIDLSSPLAARIAAQLEQRDTMPWTITLDAPAFDPRENALPDSTLQSMAATLSGTGSLQEGALSGFLKINEDSILLDRVHFVRHADAVDLDTLIHFGGGRIEAQGVVETAKQPVASDMKLAWQDVVVPETLAGQALYTRGSLQLAGSAESYRVNGRLEVGPKERIADLELKVSGTPERVELEQFDVVQTRGRLAATGRIDLHPNLGWSVRAHAKQFDPSAFAAEWKGSLNFQLTSEGSIIDSAPQGSLQLADLRGRLRNRDLSGRADIEMKPGMVLIGDLDLKSGRSTINLTGRKGDTMNAVATLEVPSVNDWLPNGGGDVQGRIEARGRWPDIEINGRLHGSALHVATLRADTLAADWNVHKPTAPSGAASIEATKLSVSGFEFATVRARVEGDAQRHRLDFDASGSPLATAFLLEGSQRDRAWQGQLQRLTIGVKDAAHLTLQRPVTIDYSPQQVRVSQACLADREVRLCLEGERATSGALQARYDLQNVPLGLANTFAPASMPLRFEGTLAGRGDIEGTADGVYKGRADIRSPNGRITRQFEATADQPEVLLSYADFALDAELDGATARARLDTRLNDTGNLRGHVTLQGLAQPTTNIDGELTAMLPSLRVIEMFAPQLANVRGRADMRANVRGTLDAPQVNGEFRASDLATDVPELGLTLKSGTLTVTPQSLDAFKIAGTITSGSGQLQLSGDATTAGNVNMRVNGKQFQAADIPSANVVIDPDLDFVRTADGMRLTGSLKIPAATIDLQKLPKKEHTQNVSADVVVIDAKTQEQVQAESAPLSADINVTLGEKVKLAGYGLDAKVDGQLDVKERPGTPTTGSGEVRVAGTYKAYGQDLTIKQGQLLFAGTPIDNPRLSIVAVREIEGGDVEDADVTAGLRITGSAQSPQLTVFSEPAMSQSDALAYLVTGKPLSEVGHGDGDGDMLQTAARSLGTAAGGLLAKNIGKRLGVDEVGIKDDEAIGGAALTVGQYLSPRLYLSYGIGLFDPGEVITLRYKISKELAVEALNGPEDSRAGIEYRTER